METATDTATVGLNLRYDLTHVYFAKNYIIFYASHLNFDVVNSTISVYTRNAYSARTPHPIRSYKVLVYFTDYNLTDVGMLVHYTTKCLIVIGSGPNS